MTDRTSNLIPTKKLNDGRLALPIANGVVIGAGALVQAQSGYLNHWDGTGTFLGLMDGGKDRLQDGVYTGNTSDALPPEGYVEAGGVTLTGRSIGGSPTQADVWSPVYCPDSDPNNLTLTSNGTNPVGVMTRYKSATDVDVQLIPAHIWATFQVTQGIGSVSQTVTNEEFTDGGGTTGTLTMDAAIPAGAIILGTKVLVTEGFAGNVSATLQIGDGSDADRYMTGTPSVFAAAATGIQTGVPSGNKLVTTANQPVLTVTANSDFTSVSAGAMTVTIYYIRTN